MVNHDQPKLAPMVTTSAHAAVTLGANRHLPTTVVTADATGHVADLREYLPDRWMITLTFGATNFRLVIVDQHVTGDEVVRLLSTKRAGPLAPADADLVRLLVDVQRWAIGQLVGP